MTKMQVVAFLYVGSISLLFLGSAKKSWSLLLTGMMMFVVCFVCLARDIYDQEQAMRERASRTFTMVGVVQKSGQKWSEIGECIQELALTAAPCTFRAECTAFIDFSPRPRLGEEVEITYILPPQTYYHKCRLLKYKSKTREKELGD